jgi:hypothetical protein
LPWVLEAGIVMPSNQGGSRGKGSTEEGEEQQDQTDAAAEEGEEEGEGGKEEVSASLAGEARPAVAIAQ